MFYLPCCIAFVTTIKEHLFKLQFIFVRLIHVFASLILSAFYKKLILNNNKEGPKRFRSDGKCHCLQTIVYLI